MYCGGLFRPCEDTGRRKLLTIDTPYCKGQLQAFEMCGSKLRLSSNSHPEAAAHQVLC